VTRQYVGSRRSSLICCVANTVSGRFMTLSLFLRTRVSRLQSNRIGAAAPKYQRHCTDVVRLAPNQPFNVGKV
jgi:hypothetical protein